MIFGDAGDDAESLEVEDDLEGLFEVSKYVGALLCEFAKLKDDVFIFVHVFDEFLDESAKLFPEAQGARFLGNGHQTIINIVDINVVSNLIFP